MSTEKERNLFYLEELSDYKVADNDKDVRGWDVKDKDGTVVGKVDNLLVNKNTKRVVYLDVEVDASIIKANHKPYSNKSKDGSHEFLNKDGEDHLIVPIGLADLNMDSETVLTKSIDRNTFSETKRMKKGSPLHREYEEKVLDSYNRDDRQSEYPKDDLFYDREEFATK